MPTYLFYNKNRTDITHAAVHPLCLAERNTRPIAASTPFQTLVFVCYGRRLRINILLLLLPRTASLRNLLLVILNGYNPGKLNFFIFFISFLKRKIMLTWLVTCRCSMPRFSYFNYSMLSQIAPRKLNEIIECENESDIH